MHQRHLRHTALAAALLIAAGGAAATDIRHPDHYEFNAALETDFSARAGRWPIALHFDYPEAGDVTAAAWTLEAVDASGRTVRRWQSITRLIDQRAKVRLIWDGKDARRRALASGYYTLRLRAAPTVEMAGDAALPLSQRIRDAFDAFPDELHEQSRDVMVGTVAPARMPAFGTLPVGLRGRDDAIRAHKAAMTADGAAKVAAIGLPYTIYYGNLHSQTNHSDGGGALGSCTSSQAPQAGVFGPTDAFAMMQTQAGGDFLLASEHNHMYDGSTGTATSTVPANAIALFDSGLQAAGSYNAAHPDFLALYGLEWGVISGGGHLNIVNPDALPNWELNASNQLIGEVNTPKSDYAALYAAMRQHGWIGQFNHPSSSQFAIGATGLAYDANGAEVMVLTEILNSSAFSTNTSETETSRSSFVGAWNTLLERGYKLAPATNQDNHCANWGLSFSNRTGVLLPTGASFDNANFVEALRARRVFATEDKTGQLVLTANGRVMGETFGNTGALTLTANFASSSGQTAQRVQFFHGVPGRNGTVTQLAEGSGNHSFTPAEGEHFYYALVTQANGLRLWSAPVWVSQSSAPADTTPPTISAGVAGASGTITLSANATDNVGVGNVQFAIDGLLVGNDTSAPYALAYDSTALANGSHSLVATAFDAAGNRADSAAVGFSIDNAPPPDTTPPTVSAAVAGSSGTITLSATAADNVGVSNVEFYVDGTLGGNDATAPYALPLDSTTLADGSHSLTARAYDAAGNQAASTAVAFNVANSAPPVERILNGGFESGRTSWTASNGVVTKNNTFAARTGIWKAWLNGNGSASTEFLYQSVAIPSAATSATLSFWLRVASDETTTTTAFDTLKIQVRNGSNTVLGTLATYSNLNKGSSYVQRSFDVGAYRGQTIRIYFEGIEGSQVATSFLVDDVSLTTR